MWGRKSPSKELLSPVLGIIERLWGIIESLLRITKPAEGINKPYMGDVLSYKALPLLMKRNICHYPNVCESCGQFIRTNLLDSYYLKIFLAKLVLISEPVVLFITITWGKFKQNCPCNDEHCCGLAAILCERISWPFKINNPSHFISCCNCNKKISSLETKVVECTSCGLK